jgi:hypothetical protein
LSTDLAQEFAGCAHHRIRQIMLYDQLSRFNSSAHVDAIVDDNGDHRFNRAW